jgi:HK97 family phage portal protein
MPSLMSRFSRSMGGLFPRWGGHGGQSTLTLLLPGSSYDYEQEAGDLWRNSVVALSLGWLSDRFCKPPLRVSRITRGGEYAPLPRHPLVDLWSKPSAHFMRRNVETAIALSIKCDGNGYLHKVRNAGGKGPVKELWWVPHFRCSPTWTENSGAFVDGYDVTVDGEVMPVPFEDIIHFRYGIDPRNERLGLAPLKSQLREVCTVNEESSYTAALLRNSAVPGLMVVPDDEGLRPSKEDAERIKERILAGFGKDQRGSSVVLGGKYKVVPVGFSPEQLKLDVLPQAAVSRVAASLGVAPMSLGLPDPGKTYANLEEANRSSWSTIQAIQDVIAETLRWNMLPELNTDPYTHVVEYDYSNVSELQESLDLLHARVREDFKAKIITKNEARDVIGFDPVPDGDDFAADAPPPMLPNGKPGQKPPTQEDDEEEAPMNGTAKAWRY